MAKLKQIKFFENSQDNLHCLQSCLKSILSFYFPDNVFSDKEIDTKTLQRGGHSWLAPAVVWLNELGLRAVLITPPFFDYKRLLKEGESYMKEFKGEENYLIEEANGTYAHMPEIQKSVEVMINKKLLQSRMLTDTELKRELREQNTFAILKTVHEWLDGNSSGRTSHYVLAIEEYSNKKWRVHDPGLPGIKDRKIRKKLNGKNIYGEVLLIKGIL